MLAQRGAFARANRSVEIAGKIALGFAAVHWLPPCISTAAPERALADSTGPDRAEK
jgi:hypothetical protein